MTVMERLANSIIVPVVVLDKVEDAVPTAKAMAAGGVDTMEITFRTACAPEAIRAVAENCPEVLVGAGTIINVEQARLAVEMGAKFIVSPGFSEEVVGWCVENNIPVAPGCVTPTEIMAALKHGLKMVKFFPANVYGGLNAMKNLSAPFVGLKFLPPAVSTPATSRSTSMLPSSTPWAAPGSAPRLTLQQVTGKRSPSFARMPVLPQNKKGNRTIWQESLPLVS